MRSLLTLILSSFTTYYLLSTSTILSSGASSAGHLEGYIYDKQSKEPISFATVYLKNISKGNYSDLDGYYMVDQLPVGVYELEVSYTGYKTICQTITIKKDTTTLNILLETNTTLLEVVEVRPDRAVTQLQQHKTQLSKDFITKVPSGDDIMQVMEVIPGVSSPPGFTNELNIRGGASFENKFTVDGMVIPIINHFANTGTNGGFRSILHQKTIKQASLQISQLPIQIGDVTSGVFDFQIMEGNDQHLKKSIVSSTTDASVLVEGPISKQANFIISYRQAYLKPTLTLLNRPILSNYNDWLYKVKWKKANHLVTFLGIGSTDRITENFNAPLTPINQYLLSRLSTSNLWHNFNGLKYQNLRAKGYTSFQLTNYVIKDQASKIETNPQELYTQRNTKKQKKEISIQIENVQKWAKIDLRTGVQASYYNFYLASNIDWKDPENLLGKLRSRLSILKWATFMEISQTTSNRIFWSLGARIDTDNYTKAIPLQQFSPRLRLSYQLNSQQVIYANAGRYFQLPPTIVLGYRNLTQNLINQNSLTYFGVNQLSLGWKFKNEQKATNWKIELFQKNYHHYPISTNNQLPITINGEGLSTFISEKFQSNGRINTHGLEITCHPSLSNGFYGLVSYTLNQSIFKNNADGSWQPTTYDARHILNITGGKKMCKNWHWGFVFRLQTGVPYTPWDIMTSSQKEIWASTLNVGLLNYELVNAYRTQASGTLDIRIDKTFKFEKTKIKVYLDFLNIPLAGKTLGRPLLTTQKDDSGLILTNPDSPQTLQLEQIDNNLSAMIPSLGLSWDF